MDKDILNIFPSFGALLIVKNKYNAAHKGYKLLKKKSDALQKHQRTVTHEMLDLKKKVIKGINIGFGMISSAKLAVHNFNNCIMVASSKPHIKTNRITEYDVGCAVTKFECLDDGVNDYSMIGLSRGGEYVRQARAHYVELIKLIIELASHQAMFLKLEEVIKTTNRRVNALEHILMPRFLNTISYINLQLDKMEREDYYRMKRIKTKNVVDERKQIYVNVEDRKTFVQSAYNIVTLMQLSEQDSLAFLSRKSVSLKR